MAEAAPTSFPAGDPRNAQYNETVAKLLHGVERQRAEAGEARQNANTNAEYATSQVAKGEPTGFRNLRNRAGKEGLTHSGILGGRTEGLQSQYAARRYAITHGNLERQNQITRSANRGQENFENAYAGALTNAQARAQDYNERNPVAAPPAPTGTAATAAAQIGYRSAAARRVGGKYVYPNGPKGPRVYQAWA